MSFVILILLWATQGFLKNSIEDSLLKQDSQTRVLQEEEVQPEKNREDELNDLNKSPAFADPGFCGIEFKQPVSRITHSSIDSDWLPNLSNGADIDFTKYFQGHYSHNSSMVREITIGGYSKFDSLKIKTNHVYLLENKADPDYFYIGFGETANPEDDLPEDAIQYQLLFTTKKENIKQNKKWYYDFKIKDDFAFCFFGNDKVLKYQLCKIDLNAKTWGSKKSVSVETKIYFEPISFNNTYEVSSIRMNGGQSGNRSTSMMLLLGGYFFIPWLTAGMSLYFLRIVYKDKRSKVSTCGFFFTVNIMFTFIFLSYLCAACLNIFLVEDVLIFVIFIFTLICFVFVFSGYVLFGHSERVIINVIPSDLDGEALFYYILFYFVTIPILLVFLGPFLLYNVYMCPSMYFTFSNFYLINIVGNIIGKDTFSDFSGTILINGIYFGILPFTPLGPREFVDEYTLNWFIMFVAVQTFYAVFIYLQQRFGSRFILPKSWRTHVYDSFICTLEDKQLNDQNEQCDVGMNPLGESELEYKDADKKYQYREYEREKYFKLAGGHQFHPNGLLKMVKIKNEGPKGLVALPKYKYDD